MLLALVCGAFVHGVAAAQAGAGPASAGQLQADEAAPSPAYLAAQQRWKKTLDAFATADREHMPASGGVLFFGSSSIRMWNNLAKDFREVPVIINRGFGGATMNECRLLARDLVVRYQPRHVLVYAGDNDLAQGRAPLDVLDDFARFARLVRETLPDTRISYISIKPSPAREALLPRIRETNNIVAAYVRTQANVDYIDIFSPMMGADNRPRGELFLPDRLHMNEAGYRLWQGVIATHVRTADGAALTAAHMQAPQTPATAEGSARP